MSRKGDRTRERALQAAHALLAEHGYHGVSMGAVADGAGITRQALYLHFPSKAELLVALARHVDDTLGIDARVAAAREAKTPEALLDAGVEVYVAMEPRIHALAQALDDARGQDEAAAAAWEDRMAFRRGNVRGSVEALDAAGRLAPGWSVDEAADLLMALLSPHTYRTLVLERGWSVERLADRLRAAVRVVLAPLEAGETGGAGPACEGDADPAGAPARDAGADHP